MQVNKLFLKILMFGSITYLFSGCTRVPKIKSVKQTTFRISGFFSECTKKLNGNGGMIDFDGNLVVFVYQNGQRLMFDNIDFKSDPNSSQKLPISIKANIPSDGTYAEVDVNVSGKDCSSCANNYSILLTEGTECRTSIVGYNVAALPRASGGIVVREYKDLFEINNLSRIPNVPFSCGCTVKQ
jgi:hypothetical protein